MMKLFIGFCLIVFCSANNSFYRSEVVKTPSTYGEMYTKYIFNDPNNRTTYYLLVDQAYKPYIAPMNQYLTCGGLETDFQEIENRTLIYQIDSKIKKYSPEYLYVINKQDHNEEFVTCLIDKMTKKSPINILLDYPDFDYINYALVGYVLLLISFLISLLRR